jgi:hypothetical protein
MQGLGGLAVWLLLAVAVTPAAPPTAPAAEMQEITVDQVDQTLLTSRGQAVLASSAFTWRHAQTEHFVVHFENGIYASKVARMAEFFHTYVSADLQGAADRLSGRSHVFIFRNEKDWRRFQTDHGQPGLEWSFSMVEGPVMYLQQAGNASDSAEVLGHEMTHLVVNRFIEGRLPLWLNEGLAEWYGEFAYAAFKGVKKSKGAQFKRMSVSIPLADLLHAGSYPADPKAVPAFYAVSKHLVGFLQLKQPPEKFVPFVRAMAGGATVESGLTEVYAFADLQDFAKQFDKFCR